ncbi:MAG: type IV pilus assembly protein PilM [Candidatus Aureabacteria bacterium]|nr:type IV pilus assembly protein PilM [Candidatus Auribacterota bacterium]
MLFSQFGAKSRKARQSVGLDIGYSSIKMVAVTRSAETVALFDCASTPLPGVSDAPVPLNELKRALTDTVGRSGLDLSDLRVSVSGKGAIVRHTDMPRMSVTELRSSIRYEAETLLPFSLDDCIFDCHILDPDAKERPKMKVVLAAARKTLVQERVDLLKEVGLVPRVVTLDAIALANAFESACPPSSPDETVSVVHIGAVRTILNIVSGGVLELTRDIEQGGSNATIAIARGLGIDYAEAERRKEAADQAVREPVSAMNMVLVRELRATFSYISSKMNKAVGKIFLSGGGALSPWVREALASEFGIEILHWDPLKGISSDAAPVSDEARMKKGILAVAAGLALSE